MTPRPHHLLIVVTLGLIATGCEKATPPAAPPPEVTVATPEIRDLRESVIFTGNLRARQAVEIRARVSGTLETVAFEPSERVAAGQLLFVIEQDYYRAVRDEAQAALESAQAELARAEADLDRLEKAIRSNAVSQQDLDTARAVRDQGKAAVLGAQARLAKAELDLGYTEVRSPIAGQVGRNLVDAGNIVGGAEATLLTTVNDIDPIYAYFDAPEWIVLRLLAGRRQAEARGDSAGSAFASLEGEPNALVALAGEDGFPHAGWIDYIANTVDPQTGTIQIRAILPNDDNVLFPGLFVRVRLLGAPKPGQILVDEKAIGTDLGGKYVYTVGEGNVVERVYVTVGERQQDGMVVIQHGLTGDESYIADGILRARPGMPVTPLTADQVAARQAAATPGQQGGGR